MLKGTRKRSIHEMGEAEFWLSPDLDDDVSPFNAAAASFLDPAWAGGIVIVNGPANTEADTKAKTEADTKANTKANTEADTKKLKTIEFQGFSDSEAETDTKAAGSSSAWQPVHLSLIHI